MNMPDKVLVIEASGGCGEKWDIFKASTAKGGVLFDLESSVPYLGEIESIGTIWMPAEKTLAQWAAQDDDNVVVYETLADAEKSVRDSYEGEPEFDEQMTDLRRAVAVGMLS